jgi:hypothetical protein
MTEQIDEQIEETVEVPDELTLLKERAATMGIKFHPSIGLDTLKEKVNSKLVVEEPKPVKVTLGETLQQRNTRCRQEANRLIRVRLTCMDPNKKNWPGEIITISNSIVGTIKKFVPFNAEDGYHIPHMIYEHLKSRRYQEFKKIKVNGRTVMKSFLSKTFAIDVLDPLTKQELKDLADRQALNHSID